MSNHHHHRKRRAGSLSNLKKISRTELIHNSKNDRQSRSVSISDSLTKLNHGFSTLRQINDIGIFNFR